MTHDPCRFMTRRYDSFVVAEVEATGATSRDRFKTAFQRILAYIQGKNRSMGEDGKWQGRPERLDMSGMMTDRRGDTQGALNKVDEAPFSQLLLPSQHHSVSLRKPICFPFPSSSAYPSFDFQTFPQLACARPTILFPSRFPQIAWHLKCVWCR